MAGSQHTFTCRQCGTVYRKKSYRPAGEGEKYCSRECFFEWKKTLKARHIQSAWMQAKPAAVAAAHRQHCRRGYRLAVCRVCGKPHLGSGQTCSVQCRTEDFCQKQWERVTKGRVNTCAICASQWCSVRRPREPDAGTRSAYCSDECSREGLKDVRRIAKARRRTRLKLSADRISRRKVFDRDEWKCRACGSDTPEYLMGTCDGSAPELDHVIPLAKGGSHTYANVMLLCRTCNGMKAHMDLDEFLLMNFHGAELERAIQSTSYGRVGQDFTTGHGNRGVILPFAT